MKKNKKRVVEDDVPPMVEVVVPEPVEEDFGWGFFALEKSKKPKKGVM